MLLNTLLSDNNKTASESFQFPNKRILQKLASNRMGSLTFLEWLRFSGILGASLLP